MDISADPVSEAENVMFEKRLGCIPDMSAHLCFSFIRLTVFYRFYVIHHMTCQFLFIGKGQVLLIPFKR